MTSSSSVTLNITGVHYDATEASRSSGRLTATHGDHHTFRSSTRLYFCGPGEKFQDGTELTEDAKVSFKPGGRIICSRPGVYDSSRGIQLRANDGGNPESRFRVDRFFKSYNSFLDENRRAPTAVGFHVLRMPNGVADVTPKFSVASPLVFTSYCGIPLLVDSRYFQTTLGESVNFPTARRA